MQQTYNFITISRIQRPNKGKTSITTEIHKHKNTHRHYTHTRIKHKYIHI